MSEPGDLLPLEPERLYRVTRDFVSWPDVPFAKGEMLRFVGTVYSRYDDAYFYRFMPENEEGAVKQWAPLRDPEVEWCESFEPAGS